MKIHRIALKTIGSLNAGDRDTNWGPVTVGSHTNAWGMAFHNGFLYISTYTRYTIKRE